VADQAATALFYTAAAAACAGNLDRATEVLTQARHQDPAQVTAWIAALADIGQLHPAALPLITVLTRPLDDPDKSERSAPTEGARRRGDDTH
jgi:hypothetical protein